MRSKLGKSAKSKGPSKNDKSSKKSSRSVYGSRASANENKGSMLRSPASNSGSATSSATRAIGSARSPQVHHKSLNTKWRWVVGLHACREVLKIRPKFIEEAYILEDYNRHQDLIEIHEEFRKSGIKLVESPLSFFENFGGGHRGIALGVSQTPQVNWSKLDSDSSQVLILDGIEDVTNLGNILRTAWLLGVKTLFVPEMRAAHLTPAVCKIASGGAEHVAVEVVGQLGELISRLKESQYWVFGLDEKGEQNLFQLSLPQRVAWVIGAEDKGLRKSTEGFCDQLVVIPQVPGGSSYNAGVAAAICLAEGYRQIKPF